MHHFLSCDWGTSSFRLSLVNCVNGQILAKVQHDKGIKKIFSRWNNNFRKVDRIGFYLSVIQDSIKDLEKKIGNSLDQIPIIISGMASSSIGMKELPYAKLAFNLNSGDLITEKIVATASFPHDVWLISGLQKEEDVMRGEEVQAIGWYAQNKTNTEEGVLILPGTHSKHLYFSGDQIVDFKTYMTGELYEILSQHSILKNSIIEGSNNDWSKSAQRTFQEGVLLSKAENLSHALFTIRAKTLNSNLDPKNAGHFLSGLLIGHELKHLNSSRIVLACPEKFTQFYQLALNTLLPKSEIQIVAPETAEHLVVLGHLKAFEYIENNRKGI